MRTIEYKVSYENMISRIPGLFAYYERNDIGKMVLHQASDSVHGCYGKIVENLYIPCSLIIEGDVVLFEYTVYAYRTIMDNYYQFKDYENTYIHKNDIISEENFNYISTDEKSGYYYVENANINGFISVAPDTISYSEYKNLLPKEQEEYVLYTDVNDFIQFVEDGIGKIALTKPRLYKKVDDDFTICNEEDYEEKSQEEQENWVEFDCEQFPTHIYLAEVKGLYQNMLALSEQCNFYYDNIDKEAFLKDKKKCCLLEKYVKMGGKYLTQILYNNIETMEQYSERYLNFTEHGKPFTIDLHVDLVSSFDDLGIMTVGVTQWIPYKMYYKGDIVSYEGEVYICIADNGTIGRFDEDLQTRIFDNKDFELADHVLELEDEGEVDVIEITGETDSKLCDLRRGVTFINNSNVEEEPSHYEDWLFYYRKGEIRNIEMATDSLGNLLTLDGKTGGSEDANNLAVYGDVITDIVVNEDTETEEYNTITFKYTLGVHLKGVEHGSYEDDDKNTIHTWGGFEIDLQSDDNEEADKTKSTEINYEETYIYDKGSELDELINRKFSVDIIKENDDETITTTQNNYYFEEYINGEYDGALDGFKFKFWKNLNTYQKRIYNREVSVDYVPTNFNMLKTNNNNFLQVLSLTTDDYHNKGIPVFREEYFNGITYAPTKNMEDKIERGITSCFEKHISLGECKTMEDIETYQNGSFFPMIES